MSHPYDKYVKAFGGTPEGWVLWFRRPVEETPVTPASVTFIDGGINVPGCKCGPSCEMPCFQREGLTNIPCCTGCPPLPNVDEDEALTEDDLPCPARCGCNQCWDGDYDARNDR